MIGDPPGDTHWRRNLDAVMDGKQLLAIGTAPAHKCLCWHKFLGSCIAAHTSAGPISTPRWLWQRQHHAEVLSARSPRW